MYSNTEVLLLLKVITSVYKFQEVAITFLQQGLLLLKHLQIGL
jgi:hypothetical protein